jgi:hypothetical protein
MSITRFQLEGLHLLGYTRRESEFLFLVAAHSGYFTNCQFKSFTRTESGSISRALIPKLLYRKHASYQAYRSGERVYRVLAGKVYQAIERANLRTLMRHELDYVKTRLVALDFVLGHPEYSYLDTEAEKVAFFENTCRVGRETLPVKQYRAKNSGKITPHYFVDRFPMFVNAGSSSPLVTFTYVAAGAVTLGGFRTHLRMYFRMFQALPSFEFIYIAPTSRLFRAAESEFHRVLYGPGGPSTPVNVLKYFQLRKAWDAKERVVSADVVLLKEAQQRYAGSATEEVYRKWRSGVVGDDEVMQVGSQSTESRKGAFRTVLSGSSLKVFSDPIGSDVESRAERDAP